ncbi:S8/S53 family peptidase [Aliikangiella coralliicola]|uniref:S8/S53 family peptidase n=1 Tax=Aliikangiella coralliicola TaxID=2592383 RepID=A0A545U4E0_9GAMM|nr:S8/S53 family peptidase [Aliikangiella coralliicola]TQV84351.1 S8/S53 family peptidase [Aliikangiella coralliicola]
MAETLQNWMRQGVYRVLDYHHADSDGELIDWDSLDKEFIKLFGKKNSKTVRIAVLDTPVIAQGYLGANDKLQHAAREFFPATIRRENLGAHGTFVAGRAGWGTPAIRILDVPIGYHHGSATHNMRDVYDAIVYAIEEEKVSIICCSVTLNFAASFQVGEQSTTLSQLLAAHPDILFVMTSGNNHGPILPGDEQESNLCRGRRYAPKLDHVLCVGGCTRRGQLHWQSMYGEIDVWAPSGYFPQFRPSNADIHGGGAPKDTRSGTMNRVILSEVDEFNATNIVPYQDDEAINYVMDSGVSFAVPMVANVAAKIKLLQPKANAKKIAQIIRKTSRTTHEGIDFKASLFNPTTGRPLSRTGSTQVKMLDPAAAYKTAKKSNNVVIGIAITAILFLAAGGIIYKKEKDKN